MDDALMDPAKRTHMTDAKVAAYGDAARNTPGFLSRSRCDIANDDNIDHGFARGRRRARRGVRGVGG